MVDLGCCGLVIAVFYGLLDVLGVIVLYMWWVGLMRCGCCFVWFVLWLV